MFRCKVCMLACLRAILPTAPGTTPCLRLTQPSQQNALRTSLPLRRTYASEVLVRSIEESPKWKIRRKNVPSKSLEEELRYLSDPLKLADNTVGLLRDNEYDKALELVRMASRKMPCAVSWNHLIGYDMEKKRVTSAVKLYNEMKKRAQRPDSYTYTILLRGFAACTEYPQSLPRALSIYHSMYSENSPVRPAIIHTNAALNVCARAGDIDALFGIAAKLPNKGSNAADNRTFTTIINGIHNAAQYDGGLKKITDEQRHTRQQSAVFQGRRMWDDIIGRWKSGTIQMDEKLVLAMGRLLLLGATPQDYDDVLSLVEQTMGIPRAIPRLGDPARETPPSASDPLNKAEEDEGLGSTITGSSRSQGTINATPQSLNDPSKFIPTEDDLQTHSPHTRLAQPGPAPPAFVQYKAFDSTHDEAGTESHLQSTILPTTTSQETTTVTSHSLPTHLIPSAEFATIPTKTLSLLTLPNPGPSILSLLLSSLEIPIHLASTAGRAYWTFFTTRGTPDAENYTDYMRLLRLTRASRECVAILSSGFSNGVLTPQYKYFRIAMSTCARDKGSPQAVQNASQVVALMVTHLEEMDLATLEKFASVLDTATVRPGANMLKGLDVLDQAVRQARSQLYYGEWEEVEETKGDRKQGFEEEFLQLVGKLVGLYGKVARSLREDRGVVELVRKQKMWEDLQKRMKAKKRNKREGTWKTGKEGDDAESEERERQREASRERKRQRWERLRGPRRKAGERGQEIGTQERAQDTQGGLQVQDSVGEDRRPQAWVGAPVQEREREWEGDEQTEGEESGPKRRVGNKARWRDRVPLQ